MQFLGITGNKRTNGSKLSAHELIEQKAFLCCSVSPNAGKEQRERKRKGLVLTVLAVLPADTSWWPPEDESPLVTLGISLSVKLFFVQLHLFPPGTVRLLEIFKNFRYSSSNFQEPQPLIIMLLLNFLLADFIPHIRLISSWRCDSILCLDSLRSDE